MYIIEARARAAGEKKREERNGKRIPQGKKRREEDREEKKRSGQRALRHADRHDGCKRAVLCDACAVSGLWRAVSAF